jgi:DNA-3-methyladenine glycosylase I
MMHDANNRCAWVSADPLYIAYHDDEWGKPVYQDRVLFEFLILEGMQAGLSWLTILKKRQAMGYYFDSFDANKIARYDQSKVEELLKQPSIIRNRAKIEAMVQNAKAFLALQQRGTCFSDYIWRFVDYQPINNHWQDDSQVPSETHISKHMAKELKRDGFKFVGNTICYAFMQAVGLVNDHTQHCFLYKQ